MQSPRFYFLVYLILGAAYAIISMMLDVAFGYSIRHQGMELIHYTFYFYLFYAIVALPLILGYNILIDYLKIQKSLLLQLLIALAIALPLGYYLKRSGISFYINELRLLKNIILCVLIALGYSLAYFFYVRKRKV